MAPIFANARYAEAMQAALEERVANGGPVARLHSVAPFFVSRVYTEIDKRLLGRLSPVTDTGRVRPPRNPLELPTELG